MGRGTAERPLHASRSVVEVDASAAAMGEFRQVAPRPNEALAPRLLGTVDDIDPAPARATPWRPRSIVFVSWRDLANPMAGGSELLVHQLASGLAERGYEVSLLCGDPVEPNSLYRVTGSGGQY